jgi:hypothetical protein
VRVGVHTGPAVMEGCDWYGSAVNVAARPASEVAPNEALIDAPDCRAFCATPSVPCGRPRPAADTTATACRPSRSPCRARPRGVRILARRCRRG